jgi:dTDP-4-dehydrorhamnose reductase
MRVCVLGHRGMLGHVVARYLSERGCTVTQVRCRFTAKDPAFIREIEAAEPEWCINCTGLRASAALRRDQLFEVNALLPQYCAQALRGRARFLQASTDGVFRPDSKDRRACEKGDATDDYGVSKWSAEEAVTGAGGIVLRCSILGPELGEPRSLFGWFLSRTGEVNGYTNHFWNGITTLEWAKVCWELMSGQRQAEVQVVQPGIWPAMSKCEVLHLIGQVWGLKVKVRPAEAVEVVVRTLIPTLQRSNLQQQLRELKAWYEPQKSGRPPRQASGESTARVHPSRV